MRDQPQGLSLILSFGSCTLSKLSDAVGSRGRCLGKVLFGHAGDTVSAHRSEIHPWGFANRSLEKKFVEQFWLTFAWNYKRLICAFYSTIACIHVYTVITEMLDNFWNPLNIVSGLRAVLSIGLAILFSRPHLSSFARWLLWAVCTCFHYVGPGVLIVQSCSPGANKVKFFLLTVGYALWGPIVWPYWITSAVWVVLLGWAPIVWRFLHGATDNSSWMELCLGYLCISVAGPMYGAWVAVRHRVAWLAQHKDAARSRRSNHGSAVSSKDPRSAQRKARSLSRERRKPSLSPLPPLSEDASSTPTSQTFSRSRRVGASHFAQDSACASSVAMDLTLPPEDSLFKVPGHTALGELQRGRSAAVDQSEPTCAVELRKRGGYERPRSVPRDALLQ